MDWLNYHHLFYFWVVAREGSIAKASVRLDVASPTISGQIHQLEEALGQKLFARAGRGLALTEVGRTAFRYSEDIFGLGQELLDTIKGRTQDAPNKISVGVVSAVPRHVAQGFVGRASAACPGIAITVRTGTHDTLVSDLAVAGLDIVISDTQGTSQGRTQHTQLSEEPLVLMGTAALVAGAGRDAKEAVRRMPLLLPSAHTQLRRVLDGYFEKEHFAPQIAGQFDDPTMLRMQAAHGTGLAFIAKCEEKMLAKELGLVSVPGTLSIAENFFAISTARRTDHPAVLAILSSSAH